MTQLLLEDFKESKFKNTLFESVSHYGWDLEAQVIMLEFRDSIGQELDKIFESLCATQSLLIEEEKESDSDLIAKFLARKTISNDHVAKLKGSATSVKDMDVKVGWFTRMLKKPFERALDRISKTTKIPVVDDKVQEVIKWIENKKEGKLDPATDNLIKKVLRAILDLSQNTKARWLTYATLLLLGVAQSVWGLPLLGTATLVGVLAAILRIISDLRQGRSVAYALGKATAIFGLGYSASEIVQSVWSNYTAASSVEPPATPPSLGDVPTEPHYPADPSPRVDTSPDEPAAPAVPSSPYIDALQRIYGQNIDNYTGSFNQAFAAARKELGAGKIASWLNPQTGEVMPFTTNYRNEGQFNGISQNVVNFLRGRR